MAEVCGFRVSGLGFRFRSLGFGGLGFGVWGLGFHGWKSGRYWTWPVSLQPTKCEGADGISLVEISDALKAPPSIKDPPKSWE